MRCPFQVVSKVKPLTSALNMYSISILEIHPGIDSRNGWSLLSFFDVDTLVTLRMSSMRLYSPRGTRSCGSLSSMFLQSVSIVEDDLVRLGKELQIIIGKQLLFGVVRYRVLSKISQIWRKHSIHEAIRRKKHP